MKSKLFILSVIVICLTGNVGGQVYAQRKGIGQIHWVEGYISAKGEGTAMPSGNRVKDQLRAVRAATILAQRALLETVKELKIDSQTKVQNKMLQEDAVHTRIEGTIQGAETVKQDVRWEGNTPIATVEMRICLSGIGDCKSEKSLISALSLDHKSEQVSVPSLRLNDIGLNPKAFTQKAQDIIYDSGKPVTGIIFNLQGLFFERVVLPVVITFGEGNKPFTVYSVKSVDPPIIRTYGIVRYADSVEQAKQIAYIRDNAMVIPVSKVAKIENENLIVIEFDVARLIRETTSHGNDYLKEAKVVISAK